MRNKNSKIKAIHKSSYDGKRVTHVFFDEFDPWHKKYINNKNINMKNNHFTLFKVTLFVVAMAALCTLFLTPILTEHTPQKKDYATTFAFSCMCFVCLVAFAKGMSEIIPRAERRVGTAKQAKEKGLLFVQNLYGDYINRFDCRSLWKDQNGDIFLCDELYFGPEANY